LSSNNFGFYACHSVSSKALAIEILKLQLRNPDY